MKEEAKTKEDDDGGEEETRQKQRIFDIDTAAQELPPQSPTRSLWSLFQRSPPNPTLSSAPVMDAKPISGDVKKDELMAQQAEPDILEKECVDRRTEERSRGEEGVGLQGALGDGARREEEKERHERETSESPPAHEPIQAPLSAADGPFASLAEDEITERNHAERKEDDDEDLLRTEEKRQKRRIFEIETAAQEARPAALSPQRTLWGLFQRSPTQFNPPLSSARTMDAELISGDVNNDDFRDQEQQQRSDADAWSDAEQTRLKNQEFEAHLVQLRQQHEKQNQHQLELKSITDSAKTPLQVVAAAEVMSPDQTRLSKMLEEFELDHDAEELAKTAGIKRLCDLAYIDEETIKELPLTPVCKTKLKRMLRSFSESLS